MRRTRLPEGLFVDAEKTFGELKFSALKYEIKEIDNKGDITKKITKRIYSLKSRNQARLIHVSIPASAGEKKFDYNIFVDIVNPMVSTVANILYDIQNIPKVPDAKWYITADDIVIKNN